MYISFEPLALKLTCVSFLDHWHRMGGVGCVLLQPISNISGVCFTNILECLMNTFNGGAGICVFRPFYHNGKIINSKEGWHRTKASLMSIHSLHWAYPLGWLNLRSLHHRYWGGRYTAVMLISISRREKEIFIYHRGFLKDTQEVWWWWHVFPKSLIFSFHLYERHEKKEHMVQF